MFHNFGTTTTLTAVPQRGAEHSTVDALSFWCLMVFTFVLYVGPQSFFPVLTVIPLAMISGGLAIILFVSSHFLRGRSFTVNRAEYRLVLCLAFVAILSIPFSRWPGGSFNLFVNVFSKNLIVFFLLASIVTTVRRMRLMVVSMAFYGIIIALIALHKYRVGDVGAMGERITGYGSPLSSNPNDLALTLNLILALVIGLLWATSRPRNKLFLYGEIGLLAAGVVVSFSRGGFLGLATILVIVFIRLLRQKGPSALITLFSLFFLLLPLILVLLPSGYGARLYSMFDLNYDETGSAQSRLMGMRVALTTILENPLLGVGLGMDNVAAHDVIGGSYWTHVHNVYLAIAVDLGLLGLVIYLLLVARLVKGLRVALKHLSELPEGRPFYALGQGLEISLLTYLVQALFFPEAYHAFFYYVAGLVVAFQEAARQFFVKPDVVTQ